MQLPRQDLTLALYQCAPWPLDTEANLRRLNIAAQRAAQQGAQVLVTPEMFITGYNIGASACRQLAQASDGSYAQAVKAIAQQQGIAIAYGYPECDAVGHVYNAAQLVQGHDAPGLNYRKTHLFGALDRNQFSAAPLQSQLIELRGWAIGLLICYDVEFGENTRRLALAGADLVLVPTANMPDYDFVASTLVPVRAYENQVAVAYANYWGAEADVAYGGLSTVCNASGQVLGAAAREESLLVCTVRAEDLALARQRQSHVRELRQAQHPSADR
ncbi:carbon-nitrogen hydrolase family protein [Rhodoferax aquaticus]|uniref:carbon-nitrogen hydrolase family protein n=1 Tax=Rhodoferax aquaticus TaxID=2527691 RepID=UPI00143D409B|nr:carbon-nitrogen hydrolase family protein [Rhodoferax aquaticus]